MARVLLTLFCTIMMIVLCVAQLNFSPSWGKRSFGPENCKTSMDSLMYIYKLIQSEAQKVVECEKFGN
ncbi:adipokinetic hormone [Lycorma delicatula]|uniref:adipokinetic hormone n=1 Tax=Lycorma delicatula TaxID=130591 RepID=UPI003F516230